MTDKTDIEAGIARFLALVKTLGPREPDVPTRKSIILRTAAAIEELRRLNYSMAEIAGMLSRETGMAFSASTMSTYLRRARRSAGA